MRIFASFVHPVLAALFLSLFVSPAFADYPVIKISSDPWEPWTRGDASGLATGGIAVDVTRELFRRLNLQADIRLYPYKRCLVQMKTGERDLLLMVKKTRERAQFMEFSEVAVTDPQLVYYSAERFKNFNWTSWQDFKGHTIGAVSGFNYGDFQAAVSKYHLDHEYVTSDEQNIRKLLAGRVDFILLSRSTARHYVTQNPDAAGKLKAAARPIAIAKFHYGFSKKGKAIKYLPKLNKALADMKADGTLTDMQDTGR